MRARLAVSVFFLALVAAAIPAGAQTPSFSVQAGGGVTLVDQGHNLSAGVVFTPLSRLSLIASVERTHLDTRIEYDDTPFGRQISSRFRGGTMTAVSGALRLSLFPEGRLTPYVIAGAGRGTSRPNVNEHFPVPVENGVGFVLAGAGVTVPLGDHASLFSDVRFMFGAEGDEGILAVIPLRAGLSWRF